MKLEMEGSYHWKLLIDVDNSSNSGNIQRTETYKITKSVSYKAFKKSVIETGLRSSAGVEAGGVIDKISIGVKGSVESDIKSTLENMEERQLEISEEHTKSIEINVGPNSTLKLYRLVFQCPGITYVTDTLSSTPYEKEAVFIDCSMRAKIFLKDINVVYTEQKVEAPENAIEEKWTQNPDINYEFGGKYVYLVPAEGATRIQFFEQVESKPNYRDLAKGTGGSFRYLRVLHKPNNSTRITDVALFRSNEQPDQLPPNGYDQCTIDLNINRKKRISICAGRRTPTIIRSNFHIG